jgi:NodT family efflux transporter outer membrane factor (OMF) lipoprotein
MLPPARLPEDNKRHARRYLTTMACSVIPKSHVRLMVLASLTLTIMACTVGPQYRRPAVQVPAAYKESLSRTQAGSGWKVAQPSDDVPRGTWWEVFQDPQLNALEEQVNVSNQNIVAAEAQLRGARAAVRVARSDLWPTITGNLLISGARQSSNRSSGSGGTQNRSSGSGGTHADYSLPLDLSYEPDLWGRIRRNIEATTASAQATAADLETVRLSIHAELAVDYFSLRGLDAQKQLLDVLQTAFEKVLELTTNRYNQGVSSRIDVELARNQLEATRAQATEVGVQRAQFEHAIAILIGQPPANLTILPSPIIRPPTELTLPSASTPPSPPAAVTIQPPVIPAGLPSELLERRPDIAAAERRVAAANAQIGIAQAAFFPSVLLSALVGFESSSLTNLFSGPSLIWSLGVSVAQIAFDAGRRQAEAEQAIAAYDTTVADYRETVLAAFQSVEDNLAALRLLEEEAQQQANAVQAAETALVLAVNRYKGGVSTYLEVIASQSVALTAERTAIDILTRRMIAAVLLIKALGGGWREAST